MPPLLDAVLLDYQKNVPAAREPEVLSTMTSIVNRLEVHVLLIYFTECYQQKLRPLLSASPVLQFDTVAPRYNAESDITRSVVDPDFLPPGVKWLGLYDGQ